MLPIITLTKGFGEGIAFGSICLSVLLLGRKNKFLAASRIANAGSKRAPHCSSSSSCSSSSGEDKTFRTRLFYIQDPDLLKY